MAKAEQEALVMLNDIASQSLGLSPGSYKTIQIQKTIAGFEVTVFLSGTHHHYEAPNLVAAIAKAYGREVVRGHALRRGSGDSG